MTIKDASYFNYSANIWFVKQLAPPFMITAQPPVDLSGARPYISIMLLKPNQGGYMGTFKIIIPALLTAFLAAACTQSAPGPQTVTTAGKTVTINILEPKEAEAFIRKNKDNPDFVILDVRTPDEFASGHIEGSLNIDYNSEGFVADLDRLDKNKLYLVYCRTARRSSDTVNVMVRLGFTKILRFVGDITRWKSEGLPVTKEPGEK